MKNASEKYGVEIPNARYIIIYGNENVDYYYELEGHGPTECAFTIPDVTGGQMLGLPAEIRGEIRLKDAVEELAANLDSMNWDGILAQYLLGEGIEL